MKKRHVVFNSRLPLVLSELVLVCMILGPVLTLAGCGEQASTEQDPKQTVVDVSGSIEISDMQDPNHSGLAYDAYTFQADTPDRVHIEVTTADFTPLLKLVEVATDAPLWEWDAKYSEEDALTYTIAGPGAYEARVYSMDGGTGAYHLTVIIER